MVWMYDYIHGCDPSTTKERKLMTVDPSEEVRSIVPAWSSMIPARPDANPTMARHV
jgi:hypothetical protein